MSIELDEPPSAAEDVPLVIVVHRSIGDRIYRGVTRASGLMTFVIMALIGLFLVLKSEPAFRRMGWDFFTTKIWRPDEGEGTFGVASMATDTVIVGMIAMTIAVPASVATALFISEYSPLKLRRTLVSMVDLLAAIPSIIYGLWGRNLLQPQLVGVSTWLNDNFGFVPIFKVNDRTFAGSRFMAGVVVSIMVLPIATSVIRQVFSQTPQSEKEAALALGGTRWGMIRAVVLPYGRGGIIGGSMLALGRALGETVAVALILTVSFDLNGRVLQGGGSTIASTIAIQFGEARSMGISALMAAGLTLFVMTLVVNMLASAIVSRSRSGSGLDL